MTNLKDIERRVAALPKAEMDLFAEWFDNLRAAQWDLQIAADLSETNLNALAEEAVRLHRAGQTSAL